SLQGSTTSSYLVTLIVADVDGGFGSATTSILLAAPASILHLDASSAPPVGSGGRAEVLVFAQDHATIDASSLPPGVAVTGVAIGSRARLIGGQGPSVLQGDSGFNLLIGGSGPDTMYATNNDSLLGGSGPSNLFLIAPGAGEEATAGTNPAGVNTLSFAQA